MVANEDDPASYWVSVTFHGVNSLLTSPTRPVTHADGNQSSNQIFR